MLEQARTRQLRNHREQVTLSGRFNFSPKHTVTSLHICCMSNNCFLCCCLKDEILQNDHDASNSFYLFCGDTVQCDIAQAGL